MSGSFDDLRRYSAALVGNAGSSVGQFLLSLVLLATLPAAGFGQFTFLLVVAQFIWALGAALFAAPIAAVSQRNASDATSLGWKANLPLQPPFQMACALAASVVGIAVGVGVGDVWPYALLVGAGGMRQFLRIAEYSHSGQRAVFISDVVFCTALVSGVIAFYFGDTVSPQSAFMLLSGAHLVAILPLARMLRAMFLRRGLANALAAYRQIWSRYSSWSLLGVIATEATANAHSYLVTLALGATGYGPIAASALLTRPGTVALNALSEFERARMARAHADGQDVRRVRMTFRAATFVFWLGSLGVTWIGLTLFRGQLLGHGYDAGQLAVAAWGWLIVLLVRGAYLPEAVEMQAIGAFRQLAWPTVWAMPISVIGTLAVLQIATPAWTLLAITLGQIVAAVLIFIQHRRALRGMGQQR